MKIGIVGLGLIGGSMGRAIIKKTEHVVFGYDTDDNVIESAFDLNAIHARLDDDNIKDIDLLIVALYPKAIEKNLEFYCEKLKAGCTVIDCCGNKRSVTAVMSAISIKHPHLNYVGAHPMAGREFSGIKHSTAGLFEHASMILVPVRATDDSIDLLRELSYKLGFAQVVVTTAEKHDMIIAFSSQLAHIVSSAYVKSPFASKHNGFSAGSFRDMTRVAKLNPEMWTQLMSENADNLVSELNVLIDNLNAYRNALSSGDNDSLYRLLEEGDSIKKEIEKRSKV